MKINIVPPTELTTKSFRAEDYMDTPVQEEGPRAHTQKEVQEMFMRQLWHMVDYWEREERAKTSREKLEGFMHSMLVMLDGGSADLPAFEVIPMPHKDDKQYHIDKGDNYYGVEDEEVTVNGEDALHELMHTYGHKFGFIK